VTLGLHFWLAPLQAFALVASPKLGLRQLFSYNPSTSMDVQNTYNVLINVVAFKNNNLDGLMKHPCDSKAWKHIQ
jgi:hypothetical protein